MAGKKTDISKFQRHKRTTSIGLDPDVMEYLQWLKERMGFNLSYQVNLELKRKLVGDELYAEHRKRLAAAPDGEVRFSIEKEEN